MNHEHCEAQNVFHTRMGYMKSWEVVQSFQKFFFFLKFRNAQVTSSTFLLNTSNQSGHKREKQTLRKRTAKISNPDHS